MQGSWYTEIDTRGETLLVTPPTVRGRACVWHGYGQSAREALHALLFMAELGFEARAQDLPGHGEHPGLLTLSALESSLAEARSWLHEAPERVVVGYSLGGRMALRTGDMPCVVVSVPAVPEFEGTLEDLWRDLSPYRVREERPLAGLESAIATWGDAWEPVGPTLVMSGARDMASVRRWVNEQSVHPRTRCVRIARANHSAAWHDPRTWQAVKAWIQTGFPVGQDESTF